MQITIRSIVTTILVVSLPNCSTTPEQEKNKLQRIEESKSSADEWDKIGNEGMAEYYEDKCNKIARGTGSFIGDFFSSLFWLTDSKSKDYRCEREEL